MTPIGSLLDAAAIGNRLSNRSQRTGRRFLEKDCPIAVYLVRGRRYVAEKDFDLWLAGQRIEPAKPQPTNLKTMLKKISDEVLEKRKAS